MLSSLMKVFAMSGAPKEVPLQPRSIQFSSGASMQFSLPENFSPDFPAEDLIEQVNLQALLKDDPAGNILMRRWWDFKPSGFFARPMGSVMMSIRVNAAKHDITNPLDFALELRERLLQINADHLKAVSYDENPMLALVLPYLDSFRPIAIGGRTWLRYTVSQGKRFELIFSHQLDPQYYITLSFEALPADNMELVPFKSSFADPHTQRIMETVQLDFPSDTTWKEANRAIEQLPEERLNQLDRQLDSQYLGIPHQE